MAYPVTNNLCLQAKFYTSYAEQLAINVVKYRTFNLAGIITLPEVVADLSQQYSNVLRPLLSEDATYIGASIQNLTDLPMEVAWYSDIGAGVGEVESVPMPGQVAVLHSLRTDYAGPSGRGRVYQPFPPANAAADDNLMAGAYHADVEASFLPFLLGTVVATEGGASISLEAGLWNVPAEILNFRPFRTGGTGIGFATQRRRGFYGKRNSLPSQLQ